MSTSLLTRKQLYTKFCVKIVDNNPGIMKIYDFYYPLTILISLRFPSIYANCVCSLWHPERSYNQQYCARVECYYSNLYKPAQYRLKLLPEDRVLHEQYEQSFYNYDDCHTSVFITSSFISSLDYNTFDVEDDANVIELRITSSEVGNVTSLQKFPSLSILDLSINNLTHLHANIFKTLLHIEDLNLSYNRIEEIDDKLIGNSLKKLDLSHNRINVIKNVFGSNNLLQELVLSNNNASINISETSPFESLVNLVLLDLSNNRLEMLNASMLWTNQKLVELDLHGNSLSTIPRWTFKRLSELTSLDLSRNKINLVDIWFFFGLKSLQFLDISENQIISLDYNTFHNTPNLKKFYINNNHLKTIDVESLTRYTTLSLISLHDNDMDCVELLSLIKSLKVLNIEVEEGPVYDSYSVHGVSCKYSSSPAHVETSTSSNDHLNISKYPNEKMEIILKEILQEMKKKSVQTDLKRNNKTNDLLEPYFLGIEKRNDNISATVLSSKESLMDSYQALEKLIISYGTFGLIFLAIIVMLLGYKVLIMYKSLHPAKSCQECKEMQLI